MRRALTTVCRAVPEAGLSSAWRASPYALRWMSSDWRTPRRGEPWGDRNSVQDKNLIDDDDAAVTETDEDDDASEVSMEIRMRADNAVGALDFDDDASVARVLDEQERSAALERHWMEMNPERLAVYNRVRDRARVGLPVDEADLAAYADIMMDRTGIDMALAFDTKPVATAAKLQAADERHRKGLISDVEFANYVRGVVDGQDAQDRIAADKDFERELYSDGGVSEDIPFPPRDDEDASSLRSDDEDAEVAALLRAAKQQLLDADARLAKGELTREQLAVEESLIVAKLRRQLMVDVVPIQPLREGAAAVNVDASDIGTAEATAAQDEDDVENDDEDDDDELDEEALVESDEAFETQATLLAGREMEEFGRMLMMSESREHDKSHSTMEVNKRAVNMINRTEARERALAQVYRPSASRTPAKRNALDAAEQVLLPEELDVNANLTDEGDPRGGTGVPKCKTCWCRNSAPPLDPLNVNLLLKFMTGDGRILPRRQTQLCAKWHRKVTSTIRRAKHMGLFVFKDGRFSVTDPFVPAASYEQQMNEMAESMWKRLYPDEAFPGMYEVKNPVTPPPDFRSMRIARARSAEEVGDRPDAVEYKQ